MTKILRVKTCQGLGKERISIAETIVATQCVTQEVVNETTREFSILEKK